MTNVPNRVSFQLMQTSKYKNTYLLDRYIFQNNVYLEKIKKYLFRNSRCNDKRIYIVMFKILKITIGNTNPSNN